MMNCRRCEGDRLLELGRLDVTVHVWDGMDLQRKIRAWLPLRKRPDSL